MKKFFLICFAFVLFITMNCAHSDEYYSSLTSGITQAGMLKPYKDISKNKKAVNNMKNQAKKLAQDDQKTVIKYVYGAVKGENTYLLINCCLRENLNQYLKPKDITKPLISRMQYYAKCLSASVSKVKLPQNTILYSNVNEKEFCSIFKERNVKEIAAQEVNDENAITIKNKIYSTEFIEKGFISTVYDKNYLSPEKFMFEIKAPKNIQGILLDGLDKPGKSVSKEILINRGYKWKVTDVNATYLKGKRYYKITIKLVI